MSLKSFDFEPDSLGSFVELPYRLYRNDANWIPPLRSLVLLDLQPTNPYFEHGRLRHFMRIEGGSAVSRATAFIDKQLQHEGGGPIGLIGLFESEEDYGLAQDVLAAACDWLSGQGITKVLGPVSFSIWHSYRFRTQGHNEPSYYGEPYNPEYYPDFFTRFGFQPCRSFGVSVLDNEEEIRRYLEKQRQGYNRAKELGFRFRSFDHSRFDQELELLYRIIVPNYRRFVGWTDLSLSDFRHIFGGLRRIYEPRLFHFAMTNDGSPAGVMGGIPDLAAAFKGLGGRTNITGKIRFLWHKRKANCFMASILSVADDYQEKGISNALTYLVHSSALELGYRRGLHGPSALDNRSTKLHAGSYLSRRYTVYDLEI